MSGDSKRERLSDTLVRRYLGLLGVEFARPSLKELAAITAAHLERVPFENISKLYRYKRYQLGGLPEIEMYLNGIERFRFGGTCYANNYHLYRLLLSLGYDVKLCGADMMNPDVHTVLMVRAGGREYLVDVGYGAPFFEPIPRDLQDDYVVELGRERFVMKPQDAEGRSRMVMHRDGAVRHGYLAKPQARGIEFFQKIIAESLRPDATFMNAVVLVRQWPGRSSVVRNMTFTENVGTEWKTRPLRDREELVAEIEGQYGIAVEVTREAMEGIGELRDVWD